ncbi:MAG: hypothetical protein QM760_15105 [Nibricoccus sp.]
MAAMRLTDKTVENRLAQTELDATALTIRTVADFTGQKIKVRQGEAVLAEATLPDPDQTRLSRRPTSAAPLRFAWPSP